MKKIPVKFYVFLFLLLACMFPVFSSGEDIRQRNEFSGLRKLSGKITDTIGKIVLSVDKNGEPALKEAAFSPVPYILPDGTVIPQTSPSEQDIFVWRIIEHEEAKKTVFLFPRSSGRAVMDREYKKFIKMNELAFYNIRRSPVVLVEPRILPPEGDPLALFADLRNDGIFYNFSAFFGSPSVAEKAAPNILISSSAFFQHHKAAEIRETEGAGALKTLREEGERNIDSRLSGEYETYRTEIENQYQAWAELQTEVFILEVERSLGAAVRLNKITDKRRISRINELQIELAKYYPVVGISDLVDRSPAGVKIEEIFARLDDICGSDTKDLYLSFVQGLSKKHLEKEGLLAKVRKTESEKKSDLRSELELRIKTAYDELLSESFSSLDDGSIGFCELTADDIREQTALGLTKKDYNLVVFYPGPPGVKEEAEISVPDMQMYEAVIKEARFPAESFRDLVIPEEFLTRYKSDPDVRETILQAYILCRTMDFHTADPPSEAVEIIIVDRRIAGLGSILKLSYPEGDKNISANYYFLPGEKVAERTGFIEDVLKNAAVPEFEKKIFSKFAKISEAARDL